MKKILIIDDDDTIRESIKEYFQLENYEINTAENGLEGIDKANDTLYDFIICDIDMPKLNGYEVVRHIKNDDRYLTVPFIFLSAKNKEHQIIKGLKLGADDYVTKPFDFPNLLEVVRLKLEKKEKLEKLIEDRLVSFKSNIAFSLPHEFLTPINGIIGPITMLTDIDLKLENDEIEEMHNVIFNSAYRLKRTVENFLIYNELNIITLEDTNFEVIDVSEVINKVYLDCCNDTSRDKDFKYDSDFTNIKFSIKFLKILINEVISNAIKFSNLGDDIKIDANTVNNTYVISVTDNGRGFKPEILDKIGAFIQFDRNYYEQLGIGLGFGIIKKIVDLFGLDLKIESEYKKFTKVEITFPDKYLIR